MFDACARGVGDAPVLVPGKHLSLSPPINHPLLPSCRLFRLDHCSPGVALSFALPPSPVRTQARFLSFFLSFFLSLFPLIPPFAHPYQSSSHLPQTTTLVPNQLHSTLHRPCSSPSVASFPSHFRCRDINSGHTCRHSCFLLFLGYTPAPSTYSTLPHSPLAAFPFHPILLYPYLPEEFSIPLFPFSPLLPPLIPLNISPPFLQPPRLRPFIHIASHPFLNQYTSWRRL